jgi:2-dehydropantoate 2-reductase
MKANDTEESLKDLAGVYRNTPVVCWQNGVENESIISQTFKRVYGGVVRFTGTMMIPGETRYAGTGKLILGPYPNGMDTVTERIAEDLSHTPFTVIKSNNIMQDKWLKLLVNLISCIKPMVKNPSRNIEKRIEICRNALEEGIIVLKKTGVTAASTNRTEDSPEKMMSNFDNALALAEGVGQGMELQNSTWQSLAKHRKILENDLYTGTIITLGEKHGVPTPYNRAILFYLHEIADKELGPESIAVDDILNKAKKI